MSREPSDIAFSETVKAEQVRRGSRDMMVERDRLRPWPTVVTPDLAALLAATRSFFLATASAAGVPHVQHRGGPPGFLEPLDETTLAFADYGGNRQYVSVGNLAENPHALIYLMDWSRRLRIKIWGRARVVEGDDALLARVSQGNHRAAAERAIVFTIDAWDRNCRAHIPRLVDADAAEERIAELEAECERLRTALGREA